MNDACGKAEEGGKANQCKPSKHPNHPTHPNQSHPGGKRAKGRGGGGEGEGARGCQIEGVREQGGGYWVKRSHSRDSQTCYIHTRSLARMHSTL
jgi:hypothetical protein